MRMLRIKNKKFIVLLFFTLFFILTPTLAIDPVRNSPLLVSLSNYVNIATASKISNGVEIDYSED